MSSSIGDAKKTFPIEEILKKLNQLLGLLQKAKKILHDSSTKRKQVPTDHDFGNTTQTQDDASTKRKQVPVDQLEKDSKGHDFGSTAQTQDDASTKRKQVPADKLEKNSKAHDFGSTIQTQDNELTKRKQVPTDQLEKDSKAHDFGSTTQTDESTKRKEVPTDQLEKDSKAHDFRSTTQTQDDESIKRKEVHAQPEKKGKAHDFGSTTQTESTKKKEVSNQLEKEGKAHDSGQKSHDSEEDIPTQLEKLYKEVDYMIRAFQKLKNFEDNLEEPLKTLQRNVEDIITDLPRTTSNESVKRQLERNLKVLRSNITKVKILIPLQHQTSNLMGDSSRYLQWTVASREAGDLPNLYQARNILESDFLKEIKDKYDGLPDDRHKLCLLCFAIFPENAEVRKSLLRFWWIGERLTEDPGSEEEEEEEEEEDRVNKTLQKLADVGFVEPIKRSSKLPATSYTMHPIVRAVVIRLAKEANFFDYDPKGNPATNISSASRSKKVCLMKEDRWLFKKAAITAEANQEKQQQKMDSETQQQTRSKSQQKENQQERKNSETQQKTDSETQRQTKSKSQQKENQQQKKNSEMQKKTDLETQQQTKSKSQQNDDSDKEQKYQDSLHKYLENLQTVFNISKQFLDLPEEEFSKMKHLLVLYLGRWERVAERHMEIEKTDFLQGLENMKKLRLFSLQGISGIKELPESVSKLSNLKMLDLRACHNLEKLEKRPKEMSSLKKWANSLKKCAKGIKDLSSLTRLAYLDISECYLLDTMPKQLAKLSELKVLKGFVMSKDEDSCRLDSLTELTKLEKLTITVSNYAFNRVEDWYDFSRFKALKKLRIAWGAGSEEQSKDSKPKETKSEESKSSNNKPISYVKKLEMPWGHCGGESSKKTAAIQNSKSRKDNNGKKSGTADKGQKWNGTQISSLEKLDLQCFPNPDPPSCLVPDVLPSLKSLYIRGGKLSYLGEIPASDRQKKWNVEFLRLKYLGGVQISWKDLQTQFPELKYLEKVKCPGITFCPCDASGVWQKESSKQN